MKPVLPLLSVLALLWWAGVAAGAEAANERDLVRVLTSSASPQEKDAACAELKRFGTSACVPALAGLLLDDQLSHSARYALESMPAREAGQALIEALPRTRGLTKAGIAASLGNRRETKAVKALSGCLLETDTAVAVAAARSLGQIGNASALEALQAAVSKARPEARDSLNDAILGCAGLLLNEGKTAQAAKAYRKLYDSSGKDLFREGSYRGLILSSGRNSLDLFKRGLTSPSGAAHNAALQLAHELRISGATAVICEVLPQTQPKTQVALIEALGQKDDPSALSTLTQCSRSSVPEVRLAAINALSLVGGADVIRTLAELAASTSGPEQAAARQALVQLHGADVSTRLASELRTAPPPAQAELARALGQSGGTAALPELLSLARESRGLTRTAALQALAALADEEQLGALAGFVTASPDEQSRSQAAEALNAVVQRILLAKGKLDPAPLLKELDSAPVQAQISFLPVLSGIADAKVREALRARLQAADPELREATIRALCDTVDPGLLPELLKIAKESKAENLGMLAVRACVRLAAESPRGDLTIAERIEVLRALLLPARSAEQKRVILAGLGEVADAGALRLLQPFISDASVANEAARAATRIAAAIPDTEPALALLSEIATSPVEPATREAAKAAQNALEARKDYITSWFAAGPYSQAGKNYAALFDVAFPPENRADAPVDWRVLPPCPDPKRPWSMDLLKQFGGEQCVAYARTWVQSENEEPAILELGSDDGIKVWLNDALVYANNTARPLTPGSDKANVVLKKGWNALLVKLTQNNLGWEFCARFTRPDGSRIQGLRFDAAHQSQQ